MEVSEDVQVAELVTSREQLGPYVPIAVKGCVMPTLMVGSAGETAIAVRAPVTLRAAVPEILPSAALMVVGPGAFAEAKPVLLMLATDVCDEAHATVALMFFVLLSV